MPVEDLLRLAWQAERDGRHGSRDVLMTLAIAECGPEQAISAERCRRRLIARRPDHFFAPFPTLGKALTHPRVTRALDQIRAIYPPARVQWLLLQGDARRGPYTGQRRSLARICDDLLGPAAELAPDPERGPARASVGVPGSTAGGDEPPIPDAFAEPAPGSDEYPALPFAGPADGAAGKPTAPDDPAALFHFYLTVLLAMAILLQCVLKPAAQDTKAA